MHTQNSPSGHQTDQDQAPAEAIEMLLREAKKLHRSAKSNSNMQALPVLRRLISSNTFRDISLPELRRCQDKIQRKHILQMLAQEAGHANWTDFRNSLQQMPAEAMEQYCIAIRDEGYPNLWFSSLTEAEDFAKKNGGRAIAVGHQAVVFPNEQSV